MPNDIEDHRIVDLTRENIRSVHRGASLHRFTRA
jgi:hypothetical protein